MDNNDKFNEIMGQTKLSFCDINDFPHYPTQDASGMPIFPDDCSITTEEFKTRFNEKENGYSLNKLRIERNILLTESDWTQSKDLTLTNDEEWIKYRKELRDLPQTTTDFNNVVYPTKPQ